MVGRMDFDPRVASEEEIERRNKAFGKAVALDKKVDNLAKDFQDVFVETGDFDFDELLNKCVTILDVKGKDYTIGSDDRLHNFKTVAEFVGVTPAQVLAVYMYKHMAAVFSHIKNGGAFESEPIDGRLADVINYCLLYWKMVKENGKK